MIFRLFSFVEFMQDADVEVEVTTAKSPMSMKEEVDNKISNESSKWGCISWISHIYNNYLIGTSWYKFIMAMHIYH